MIHNPPIEVNINKWAKELYTDRTSIRAQEENAKSEVNLLHVAFWRYSVSMRLHLMFLSDVILYKFRMLLFTLTWNLPT
jgi:hypothetical protein